MAKLSKEAFAIMAMCEETKKPFGITVNPQNGCYAFTWAFKINPDQAKREGYDKTSVRGANCGNSSTLRPTEAVDLEGGGF